MEPTGCTFLLLLLVLIGPRGRAWAVGSAGTQDDAHSLQCVYNISFNEQQRCMVEVFIHGQKMPILQYDCYKKNVISEKQEVETTNVLKDMKDTLKDAGDKMRKRLLDLKNGKICNDSSILQVKLECHINADGIFSALWEFLLDGQRSLVFYLGSGKYKADNSNGEKMRKAWENHEEMKEFLKRTAMGDCKKWLGVLERKKVLGTTAAPAIPTTAQGTAPSKAMTNRPVISIIPVILACWSIGCVLLQ